MKRTLFLPMIAFAVVVAAVACSPKGDKKVTPALIDNSATADGHSATGTAPKMKFEKEVHDFGKITQGDRVSCAFKFTNAGGSDLIISSANGSCGCTVPDYPKQPVRPGESGVINVQFNSEGKSNKQQKTVTLVTNCEPNTTVLTITADVMAPKTATPESH